MIASMTMLVLFLVGAPAVASKAIAVQTTGTADPWPFGPSGLQLHARNEAEMRAAEEKLAGTKPRELAALVRETLARAKALRGATKGAAARERDALPWMPCAAAIRMLGRTRDRRWLSVFEKGFTLEGAPFLFTEFLGNEAAWAWLRLMGRDGLRGPEVIRRVRSSWREPLPHGISWRAHYLLFEREFSTRGWTPYIVALFDDPDPRVRDNILSRVKMDAPEFIKERRVRALNDPDPGIREAQARAFRASPEPYRELWKREGYDGPGLAPALRRFAVRRDISDDAREAAAAALAVRGYRLEKTEKGWVTTKAPMSDR